MLLSNVVITAFAYFLAKCITVICDFVQHICVYIIQLLIASQSSPE